MTRGDAVQLAFLSIDELGARFRDGTASPVDAVRECLDRIERYDGRLNAWITVSTEQALHEAAEAERSLRRGEDLGPLHGVPVAVKDNIDTAGVRTTCASRILRDHVPASDAVVVERLRAAGAIVLGKTNLLEFAYGIVHPDYGQCNNPWDASRTSGGSSSGSAAAVAAGMAFAALGTDTGGSIRIPASYCGIVGMKPTYDRVSRRGVFPLSWSLDHVGPLTRTVGDAVLVLEVIAGPQARDPVATASDPVRLDVGESIPLAGARIGVVREHRGDDLRPSVSQAFHDLLGRASHAGADIVEVSVPSLPFADDALMPVIAPEAAMIHERWLRSRPEEYAAMTRSQLELGALCSAIDYVRAGAFRSKLSAEFDRVLLRVDVIVSPTVAWEAPAEDPVVAGDEGAIEARRTGPYNLTGLPAVTIPIGSGEEGLPIGLQVAGGWMNDDGVLRVARALEGISGWEVRCPTEV